MSAAQAFAQASVAPLNTRQDDKGTKGEEDMAASRRLLTVLATLEDLSDDELQAVSARALSLLLDRPVDPAADSLLGVEVVAQEESRLLGGYRALAPRAQRRLREHVRRLRARARAALRGRVLIHPRPRPPATRRDDP